MLSSSPNCIDVIDLNLLVPFPGLPSTTPTSAPISLPHSHIDNTPSELDLASLALRAEDEDARMLSRLLCQRRHEVLPLKDVRGIIMTKFANGNGMGQKDHASFDEDPDDTGWELFYGTIDGEDKSGSTPKNPQPGEAKSSPSKPITDIEKRGKEEDGVFIMEM